MFWKFIEGLEIEDADSDRVVYDKILAVAGDLMSSAAVETLKFGLATRTYSPK